MGNPKTINEGMQLLSNARIENLNMPVKLINQIKQVKDDISKVDDYKLRKLCMEIFSDCKRYIMNAENDRNLFMRLISIALPRYTQKYQIFPRYNNCIIVTLLATAIGNFFAKDMQKKEYDGEVWNKEHIAILIEYYMKFLFASSEQGSCPSPIVIKRV